MSPLHPHPLVLHQDLSSLVPLAYPKLSLMSLPTLSMSSPSTSLQNLSPGEKRNLTDYPDLPPSSPTLPNPSLPLSNSSTQYLTGRSPLPFVTSLIPVIAFTLPGLSRICMLELSPQQAFKDFTLGSAQKLFSSPHSLRYFVDQLKEPSSEKTSGTTPSSTSLIPHSCPPPHVLPLPLLGTHQPNAPPLHQTIFRPSPLKKSRTSQTSSTRPTRHVHSLSKKPAQRMTTSTQDVPGSRPTPIPSLPSPSSPATLRPRVEIDLSLLSDSD